MTLQISAYATLVFDCDGVVLDSNRIKTEAFRAAAAPWGAAAAEALVTHHVANGGISRYAKFAHFVEAILPEYAPGRIPGRDGPGLEALSSDFARAVREGLMSCAVAEGLASLRAATPHARWLIVSGGDQAELREVFTARGLSDLFDGGVYGSPDTKDQILEREIASGLIKKPAVFLGDSTYDHRAAIQAGLNFLFVSGWTEVAGWRQYVAQHGVDHIRTIGELVGHSRHGADRD